MYFIDSNLYTFNLILIDTFMLTKQIRLFVSCNIGILFINNALFVELEPN